MGINTELHVQSLENQLGQRIDKLWKIFSWTSNVLITITGGIIVLTKIKKVALTPEEGISISAIILILTIYAFFWLGENLNLESEIRDKLAEIFNEQTPYQKIKNRPDKAFYGYRAVILVLGATALYTTWWAYYAC